MNLRSIVAKMLVRNLECEFVSIDDEHAFKLTRQAPSVFVVLRGHIRINTVRMIAPEFLVFGPGAFRITSPGTALVAYATFKGPRKWRVA